VVGGLDPDTGAAGIVAAALPIFMVSGCRRDMRTPKENRGLDDVSERLPPPMGRHSVLRSSRPGLRPRRRGPPGRASAPSAAPQAAAIPRGAAAGWPPSSPPSAGLAPASSSRGGPPSPDPVRFQPIHRVLLVGSHLRVQAGVRLRLPDRVREVAVRPAGPPLPPARQPALERAARDPRGLGRDRPVAPRADEGTDLLAQGGGRVETSVSHEGPRHPHGPAGARGR
jgi:hypothetical protein